MVGAGLSANITLNSDWKVRSGVQDKFFARCVSEKELSHLKQGGKESCAELPDGSTGTTI
ncbi:hypothetical protein BSNK01_31530 [Bacillaceae bacterium]